MGGTWTTQNKVRPGVYINFKSVPRPNITVGDRGIATIGINLDWGEDDKLIDVTGDELLTGASLPKIGFTLFDEGAKLLVAQLAGCHLSRVKRMNYGGSKATADIGDLTATAKYNGILGNHLTVAVDKTEPFFEVTTFLKGNMVNRQTITEISELEANDYIVFSDNSDDGSGVLTINPGTLLTGGTNGTITEEDAYIAYMALLRTARWNTWAVTTSDSAIKIAAAQFVEYMRDREGRYVQAVIGNYNAYNHEGIISNINSVSINNIAFTVDEATSIVSGLSAGCLLTETNTGRAVRNSTAIKPILTRLEIEEALLQGFIVFTSNQDGSIVIEQDINTLHSFTPEKNTEWRKNRVVRTMDEIGTQITYAWESRYKGKVTNNEEGRAQFRSDLIAYYNRLQSDGIIQEFEGANDVEVNRGLDLDAVVSNSWIMPTDSMEKLYKTINVKV